MTAFADSNYAVAESLFARLYEHADAPAPDREVFRFMQGRCLFARGDYPACEELLRAFIGAFPTSEHRSAAWLFVGHCRFLSGDSFRTARAYVTALSEGPESHRRIAFENLKPLIQRGLPLSALGTLADELADDQWSAQARFDIAERWTQSGRRTEAMREFQRLLCGDATSDLKKATQARIRQLQESSPTPARVGLLLPLSGEYADYGQRAHLAALAAIDSTGDAPHLMVVNTGNDPLRVTQAADSLVEAGCAAVVGPLVPDGIAAAVGVLRAHDIFHVLPVVRTGQTELSAFSPWIIQLSVPVGEQAESLLEAAMGVVGSRRFALLAAQTLEAREAVAAIATAGEARGATISATEYFTPGAGDIHTSVIRLARSVLGAPVIPGDASAFSSTAPENRPLPVDALIIWGADPEDLARLIPLVRGVGFRSYLLGDRSWDDRELLVSVGAPLDSILFVSDQVIDTANPLWREFSQRYHHLAGDNPDWLAARVFDAVRWLAVQSAGDAPGESIDRLIHDGWNGASGVCEFDFDRIASGARVYRYTDGLIEPVMPDKAASPIER